MSLQNEISELYEIPEEIKKKQEMRKTINVPLLPKRK